jgi:ATP-binding cassette subfamily B multidrug efflux pump
VIRIARYLRPYLWALLGAIVLLFIQANADLALPDYMSRIVNIGIQQGGVEGSIPELLRPATLEQLRLFMTEDQQEQVNPAYQLAAPGSELLKQQERRFGTLAVEVYVLTEDDGEVLEELESFLTPAMIVAGGIQELAANPDRAQAMTGAFGMDLGAIAPGLDMSAVSPGVLAESLASMPEQMRVQIVRAATSQLEAMGDTALSSAAAARIRAEYEAIGLDMGRIQARYITATGFWMLLITLLSAACTITVGYLSARIAAGFSRDIRLDVFDHVQQFSGAEFDKFSTASLITRSTNDVMQIQMVMVMLIRIVFFAPIIGVGGVIRAIDKGSSMWWVIMVAVGVLSVLVLVVYRIAVPKFKIMQKLVDRLNLVSRESLSGMMVIRAFNMERHEEERFDKANTELTDTTLFVNRVMVVMMPVMMLIMNGLSLLIIWVGAHQIAESAMQVGDLMAFLQYTMQIVFAFLMLSMMFIMLPRAAVSADRIADVLETEPTIRDGENLRTFGDTFVPSVEFHNVSFRYPGGSEDAIHDISFTAPPGKTTAFIGATGSGKSTIVNLIPRFYDVTEGQVLVDGVDIREVSQHDLREKLGCVPQRGTLFSGTIASNLRYADENADEQRLNEAVAVAQAEEFVQSRPEGLEAEISQGGANVSGGQKQRLAIARALVGGPPIYLFDDSFSAIDLKTDAKLRRALNSHTVGSTVILVSQRVSTIRSADQIIVLDQGQIVGSGTHKELMDECEIYREIAMSQLTEEELQ